MVGDGLDLDDVRRAAARLDGIAHRTPVLTSRTLDERVGAEVRCKGEHLQRAGAFKFRGAFNTVASLDEDARRRGVAAYSSGNHAQAVALAARMHDTTAVILMPEDTPPNKLAATRGYGAEVVFYDRYTQDRTAIGKQMATDRGLTLVPPYDDPRIMAGQGTAALELVEDTGPVDLFLAPMSGGGPIRASGHSPCTAVAHPAISPPPDIGARKTSTGPVSSTSSSAAVPWPAMIRGSS